MYHDTMLAMYRDEVVVADVIDMAFVYIVYICPVCKCGRCTSHRGDCLRERGRGVFKYERATSTTKWVSTVLVWWFAVW